MKCKGALPVVITGTGHTQDIRKKPERDGGDVYESTKMGQANVDKSKQVQDSDMDMQSVAGAKGKGTDNNLEYSVDARLEIMMEMETGFFSVCKL